MSLAIKAAHLITMVAWFAGLLVLPWLLRLHLRHRADAALHAALSAFERRLLVAVMHPAMGFTLILGTVLIMTSGVGMKAGWLHVKLLFVFAAIALQIVLGRASKKIARGEPSLSEGALGAIGGVAAFLLVTMIALASLRPF